jgi:hypothetical protein
VHHRFEPEVAGGLGPGIELDPRREPPLVGPLRFEFEGWLGDDIVTTSGYWIVSGPLADSLRASALTGFELGEVVVTTAQQFGDFPLPRPFPERWERLVPTGSLELGDDIALEDRVDLLVSDAALALLRGFAIGEAHTAPTGRRPW